MWIKVHAPELKHNISIPVPLGLAGTVVGLVPEWVLAQNLAGMPEEFQTILTKPFLRRILRECGHTLRKYKGLEIVHVESADGTLVSIRL